SRTNKTPNPATPKSYGVRPRNPITATPRLSSGTVGPFGNEREVGAHPCSGSRDALHLEAPVQCLDAVFQAAETRAFAGLRPSATVIHDLDCEDVVLRPHADRGRRRVRVLDDVGEGLGDDVVRRALDRRWP